MTRYLLVLAASLLPLGVLAQTKSKVKAKPAAPTTTVSAAQFESQLSTEICQDFNQQNATKPFDQLNKEEAMNTLQQSMMQVMMKHPQEMEQMMKTSGDDASAAMREMGQRVASKLVTDCPVAMVLFARLSGSNISPKAADLALTAEERPLLNTLASEVCADISARDAAQPLASQSKEARTLIMQEAMQKSMKAHAREISERYGPEIFMDQERIFSLGAKVGGLMTAICPSALTSMGQP